MTELGQNKANRTAAALSSGGPERQTAWEGRFLTKLTGAQQVLRVHRAFYGKDHPNDEGRNTKHEAKVRVTKDEGRKTPAHWELTLFVLRT